MSSYNDMVFVLDALPVGRYSQSTARIRYSGRAEWDTYGVHQHRHASLPGSHYAVCCTFISRKAAIHNSVGNCFLREQWGGVSPPRLVIEVYKGFVVLLFYLIVFGG